MHAHIYIYMCVCVCLYALSLSLSVQLPLGGNPHYGANRLEGEGVLALQGGGHGIDILFVGSNWTHRLQFPHKGWVRCCPKCPPSRVLEPQPSRAVGPRHEGAANARGGSRPRQWGLVARQG